MDIYRIKKLTKEDVDYLNLMGWIGRLDSFVYATIMVGVECPLMINGKRIVNIFDDSDICDISFWDNWFSRMEVRLMNFDKFVSRLALKILEYNKDVLDLYGFEYELMDISGWHEVPKKIWDYVRVVKKGEYVSEKQGV
jgi:hypothetical protein